MPRLERREYTTVLLRCGSTSAAETTITVDGTEHDRTCRKLKVNQTQSMAYPPQFYDLAYPKHDTATGEIRKKKMKRQTKQTTIQAQTTPMYHGEKQEEQEEVIHHGYVGKPEGSLADVAFERGLLDLQRVVMNEGKMKMGY